MATEQTELFLLRSVMVDVMQVESSAGILLYSSETKRRKSERERHFRLVAESANKVRDEVDQAEHLIITRDGTSAAQWILGLKYDLRKVHTHAAIFSMPRYDALHHRGSDEFEEFAEVVQSLAERVHLLRDLEHRFVTKRRINAADKQQSLRPHWNKGRRELTIDGVLVKSFRRIAANQFLVLDGFEELGWPKQIDDPMSGNCDDKVQRLNDTVKSLNEQNGLGRIRFSANGSGTGFCWAPGKNRLSPRSAPTITRKRP
jgi:hypothetical protein